MESFLRFVSSFFGCRTTGRQYTTSSPIPIDKKAEKEAAMNAVQFNKSAYECLPDELKNDIEVLNRAIQFFGMVLIHAPICFQDDPEIVEKALNSDICYFEHATENIMKNRDIACMAISLERNFRFVHDELRNDASFVNKALEINTMVFIYLSEEFRSNYDLVLSVVKKHGIFVEFASDDLKANENIVCAAIRQNGISLKYASDELKMNKDIVLLAVKNEPWALKYAHFTLLNDFDVVFQAFSINERTLIYASENMKARIT